MNFVVAPDLSARRDIPRFRRVNAIQNANALAVLGVLADGNVNPVLVKHRRGVDLARALRGRVLELLAVGRIAIILPDRLKEAVVALFYRFGIEGVTPAIAAPKQDLLLSIDFRERRRAPLSMENPPRDMCVILTQQLAG